MNNYDEKEVIIRKEFSIINKYFKDLEEYLVKLYYYTNFNQKELAEKVNNELYEYRIEVNNQLKQLNKIQPIDNNTVAMLLKKNDIKYKKKRIEG